jgi:hypothetical protein
MISARFVLQRDEFVKAYRLALRNLPIEIRWAAWAQCGLLLALMLTGLAYRPDGVLGPRFHDRPRSGLACVRYGPYSPAGTNKRSSRPHDRRGDLVRV